MKNLVNVTPKIMMLLLMVCLSLIISGCDKHGKPTYNDLIKAIQNNDIQTINKIIESGGDLNLNNGLSPIWYAAKDGNLSILKLLVENGVDVNKSAPLARALDWKHYDFAEYLLNHNANPNQATSDGETPLMRVAINGDIQWAKKLLALGADVNATSKYGFTPWILARMNNHNELALFLERNGAEILNDQLAIKIEEFKNLTERNKTNLDSNGEKRQKETTSNKSTSTNQTNKYLKVIDLKSNIDQKGFATIEMNVEFLDNIYRINGTDFLLRKQGTNTIKAITGYLKDKSGPTEYRQMYKGDKIYIWIQFRLELGETLDRYILCYNYIGDPYPIYQF